jgi:hypothetical protein
MKLAIIGNASPGLNIHDGCGIIQQFSATNIALGRPIDSAAWTLSIGVTRAAIQPPVSRPTVHATSNITKASKQTLGSAAVSASRA